MSGILPNWQYADSVDTARAQRLLSLSAFSEVVELVAKAQVVDFTWEPFTGTPLAGCSRASFILRVPPTSYDAFFNSPAGYRGQYALSASDGESANRRLLRSLEPKLLSFAAKKNDAPPSAVSASLRASEAKLWIYESEVEAQLGEEQPAILYTPWAESSETGVGLLAPVGTSLEVKGGWLDRQGQERRNPAKANRSNEIHELGYS
jgi:hypothetical protein